VRAKYTDPYAWSATTVGYILKRPEYMGRLVLGKTVKESYKTKKHRKTTPDEQYVFDDALPAIVDEDTWNNAQRLRKTVRRPPKEKGLPHRLTGLLFCSDCNHKLTHRVTTVQKKWLDDAYICSSYRQLHRDCTMHYIPTKNVESIILSAIQRISWYVREHESEFIQKVREASNIQQEETLKENKRKVEKSKRRHTELDGLVKNLYESNATGKLPDKHFHRLLAEYDEEQSALEATISELQTLINSSESDKLKTDNFIAMVKRYTDFETLTTPMLNEFVEKLVVYNGDKRGKERNQRVDVYMNFIGKFELPADIVTPMELEEQRRKEEEQAAKEKRSKEFARIQSQKSARKKREFTARKRAGLLTPEEIEADIIRMDIKRIKHKEWREKRRAAMPPKPPKPLSLAMIAERVKEGLPITPEETARHEADKARKNAQIKRWREAKKASEPPKPKKLTTTAVIAKWKEGGELTPEEQVLYDAYREKKREVNRQQYAKRKAIAIATPKPPKLYVTKIAKKKQDGLPLTPEEAAVYDAWRERKDAIRKAWRERNPHYQREWEQRRKAVASEAAS